MIAVAVAVAVSCWGTIGLDDPLQFLPALGLSYGCGSTVLTAPRSKDFWQCDHKNKTVVVTICLAQAPPVEPKSSQAKPTQVS